MKSSFLLLSPARRAWPLVGLALALAACGNNVGPDGPSGPPGPTGATGAPGPQGDPGSDGAASLTDAVPLPPGDPNCAYGGTRYDTGLDNGDGGGVAGDGVLQPGEVDDSTYACDPPGTGYAGIDVPATPVGTSTLSTAGGDGVTNGGNGGLVSLTMAIATGGNIAAFRNGTVDTSFDVPGTDYVNLGSNPLVVGSSSTLTPKVIFAGGESTLADGVVFRYQDNFDGTVTPEDTDEHLYRWSTVSGKAAITGIRIEAGATLVLPFAQNAQYPSSGRVAVANDIDNAGTLSAGLSGQNRYRMYVWAEHYYGEPGSQIDQSGLDAPPDGGEGGSVFVYAVPTPEQHQTQCSGDGPGSVYNQGTIEARRGADIGPPVNASAGVSLCAANDVYNTGSIFTSGMPTNPVNGPQGGISLYADQGGVYNSGDLDASGVGGTPAGAGGALNLSGRTVTNAGMLDTRGGDVPAGSDCTAGTCVGGAGGSMLLASRGGRFANSGAVLLGGGDGSSGTGGQGGSFHVTATEGQSDLQLNVLAPGPVDWTGDLDTSGGSGNVGGSGGSVRFLLDGTNQDPPEGAGITLYGYQLVDVHGGAGASAGAGASMNLYGQPSTYPSIVSSPAGMVYDDVPLEAGGGEGVGTDVPTRGGAAGGLELYAVDRYGSPLAAAYCAADVHALGGDGMVGGHGGYLSIVAEGRVDLAGSLDLRSGAGDPASGSVDPGAGVYVDSHYDTVSVTADLDGRGGAAYSGGVGAPMIFEGAHVDFSGSIDASGGDGSTSGGAGGDAGDMLFWSTDNDSNLTGSMVLDPGAGTTPGAPATVTVDGFPWP